MKLKVDNIIYMTLFDKDHNPLWVMDAEKTEVETEDLNSLDVIASKIPEIGDHIYLSADAGEGKTIEIDGFFGGLDE